MKTIALASPKPLASRAPIPVAPLMEPELAEIASGWNARKCNYLADKFERWVNQLRASAEYQRRQRLQSN